MTSIEINGSTYPVEIRELRNHSNHATGFVVQYEGRTRRIYRYQNQTVNSAFYLVVGKEKLAIKFTP